jgi:hypothetical protein
MGVITINENKRFSKALKKGFILLTLVSNSNKNAIHTENAKK